MISEWSRAWRPGRPECWRHQRTGEEREIDDPPLDDLRAAFRAAHERAARARLEGIDARLDRDGWNVLLARAELVHTSALRVVEAWDTSADAAPFGWLLGPVGVGKSLALVYWLVGRVPPMPSDDVLLDLDGERLSRLECSPRGMLVHFGDLVRLGCSAWSDDRKEYAALIGTHRLAIDEVGVEPAPIENSTRVLFDLVDRRSRPNRRTLLASNLGWSALLSRYEDARLRDRLRASASAIEIPGRSRRKARR